MDQATHTFNLIQSTILVCQAVKSARGCWQHRILYGYHKKRILYGSQAVAGNIQQVTSDLLCMSQPRELSLNL